MTTSRPPASRSIHAEGHKGLLSNRVLQPLEYWWRDHQKWLEDRGYMLRPRYREGWTPSWGEGEDWFFRNEDSVFIMREHILDATRISDGEMVVLKRIDTSVHPHELEITQYFSTEPIASHPRNHCVPLYEAFMVPDQPNYGLQFIHQSHVAHRKEVRYRSRTAVPVKYYFIDFGISRKYDANGGPPLELPISGGDRSVPEFQGEGSYEPVNPFPTDIYYLGNMIRLHSLQMTQSLDFMEPLVADMTQNDPSKRPSIDEVVKRFREMQRTMSQLKLRSRIKYHDEGGPVSLAYLNVKHLFRTLAHLLLFRSATPTPDV
ncbi:hypothetical protein NLI96_g1044 [Meripilus lineatus]|uniref:Protein kinase domain-containing protein n=1 Tax=Meripilus lineatus TaxID=2056292 RepID=A0AAD5YN72_9APHY|nr:hypothetical protein NLI96_g1044 [Physisporinus lineatus]